MSKIEIKKMNISYGKTEIFNDLNLNIKENSYTTIIGPSSSGKTTLFNEIIKKNKCVKINGNINYILTDPNKQIVAQTVEKQLKFFLEMEGYTKRQISTRVNNIVDYFDFEKLLYKDPYLLSEGEKQLVVLCSILVLDLDILIMDNSLCRINYNIKHKVLDYFKKLKKKKVTIINFASDVGEIIGSDYTILLDKRIIFNKKTKDVIKDSKLFEDNNLELPFMLDITNKLNYYGLIKSNINNIDELVDELWK